MTAPTTIRKADLKNAADVAIEKGVVIELERNGVKYKIHPYHPEEQPVAKKPEIRL